jgi:prolipoprotein diacylglyceryl transferase
MEFGSQFIRIGQVQLQYYGIIIVTAMIVATLVAVYLAKRYGRDSEHIYGALTWAIIPGIICARMWFVFFPPVTSTNTYVPEEHTYTIQANQLFDAEGALLPVFTSGLTFSNLSDHAVFTDKGIREQDRIRSVQVAGATEATPVFDTNGLMTALQGAESADVRVDVTRQVPKDRNWYLKNFFDLDGGGIAIWTGGLSIFGALLGGGIGAYLYLRKYNLRIPAWMDIAGVTLPLAQAIGRWANYVNQELFGDLVNKNFPLALKIPEAIGENAIRASQGLGPNDPITTDRLQSFVFENGQAYLTFHPLFLYESLWSLVAFGLLFWLYNSRREWFRPGDFFLIYIVQYSFIRFLLEFLRLEVTLSNGVNVSQVVTGIAGLIALVILVIRYTGRANDSRTYEEIAPPEPHLSTLQPATVPATSAKPAKRERKSTGDKAE